MDKDERLIESVVKASLGGKRYREDVNRNKKKDGQIGPAGITLRPFRQPVPLPLLRQQPLGEIHPLGQLSDLLLQLLHLLQQ